MPDVPGARPPMVTVSPNTSGRERLATGLLAESQLASFDKTCSGKDPDPSWSYHARAFVVSPTNILVLSRETRNIAPGGGAAINPMAREIIGPVEEGETVTSNVAPNPL